MAVKEEARGSGVAKRLVQAVEAVGAALGSTTVSAAVPQEYDHHKLFERFGYQVSGEGDRLPMTKAIA